MSFLRPEAMAALRRYGEPAVYAILGGWAVWKGVVLLGRGSWVGGFLLVIGAVALMALFGAAERALVAWRGRRAGPGTVSIREGQIAYFGPFGGAIMALDSLVSVDLDTAGLDGDGEVFWVLQDEIGQMVRIPGGADGAVALLDRLGTLPGFDHRAVVQAMSSRSARRVAVWRRERTAAIAR